MGIYDIWNLPDRRNTSHLRFWVFNLGIGDGMKKQIDSTQRSFEREWLRYQPKDKTWGWNVEERKRIFLKDLNISPNDLRGKRILDAGCGNGELTDGLADFGASVVGLDIVDVPHLYNPHVTYVLGNIMYPLDILGQFDIVYCSGVIHHTPDPRIAFDNLSALVKPNGKLFVWVYGGKYLNTSPLYKFILGLHKYTSSLPEGVQDILYYLTALGFQTVQVFKKNDTQMWSKTWSERLVWVYDILSHPYQFIYDEGEIEGWFKDNGFENVETTYTLKWGIGVCGRKKDG